MPPFPVPKSPIVKREIVVGPSPSTTDSTSSRDGVEWPVTSVQEGPNSGTEWETTSVASSAPPPDPGGGLVVDRQNLANNYRKGARLNDFKNEHGIICYKCENGATLVRCANSLVTLENMDPIFLNPTGVIHFNKSLEDFFEFVVHTSGQGGKEWGSSLNLKFQDHLRMLKQDWRILHTVESLRRALSRLGGEETVQGNFLGLVSQMFTIALWLEGTKEHQIKTIGGGHVAYAPSENDVNGPNPAAVGTFIDAISRSWYGNRCVVFESKRPGEIDSATAKTALMQALTGALGERADIAIVSTGIEFAIYWFERMGGVVRIYKVLDVHDLVNTRDDDEKLIEIAAHIAFFLADVPSEKRKQAEKAQKVPAKDQAKTDYGAAGGEPAPKKPRRTLEEKQDVRDQVDQPGDPKEAQNLKASSDVWEEVKIEGPDGKFAICTVLRADLDEETRLAIMGEFEQESDDKY